MKIRNLLLCVVIMVSIQPVVVFAQLEILDDLEEGKRGLGLGYSKTAYLHNMSISGHYGFTENLKGSAQTTIKFSDDDTSYLIFSERFQMMHIDDIGFSDSTYFLLGAVDFSYVSTTKVSLGDPSFDSKTDSRYSTGVPYSSKSGLERVRFIAGVGFSIWLTERTLPFVYYSFSHARILELGGLNVHNLSIGFHHSLSHRIGVMGRIIFPATGSGFYNPVFKFGINFNNSRNTILSAGAGPPDI